MEDEPLAADVVQDFVQQVPFLELVAVCSDAFKAMEVLRNEPVGLIFLDLHLPKLKGLDFISTLQSPPMVIVTTAYHEFALQSYDYNVLDYLLKPIQFSRFMVAVNKAVEKTHSATTDLAPVIAADQQSLYFTVNKKKVRIALDSIRYIESQRENVKIVTDSKTIVTRYAISDLEKALPPGFLRIHRSFIVAKSRIDLIDANDVEIAGKEIPIGRSYRDFVLQALGV